MNNRKTPNRFEAVYNDARRICDALVYVNPLMLLKMLTSYLLVIQEAKEPALKERLLKDLSAENPRLAQADILLNLSKQFINIQQTISTLNPKHESYKIQLLQEVSMELTTVKSQFPTHVLKPLQEVFNLINTWCRSKGEVTPEITKKIDAFLKVNTFRYNRLMITPGLKPDHKLAYINKNNLVNLIKYTVVSLKRYRLTFEVLSNRLRTFAKTFSVDVKLKVEDLESAITSAKAAENLEEFDAILNDIHGKGLKAYQDARRMLTQYQNYKMSITNLNRYMMELTGYSKSFLSERIIERFIAKHKRLDLDKMLAATEQMQSKADPIFGNPVVNLKKWCDTYAELMALLDSETKRITLAEEAKKKQEEAERIQRLKSSIGPMHETMHEYTTAVVRVEKQLACLGIIKRCYPNFSDLFFYKKFVKNLEALQKNIKKKLDELNFGSKASLGDLMGDVTELTHQLEKYRHKLEAIYAKLNARKVKVTPGQVALWQENLSDLLLGAHHDQLAYYYYQLTLVDRIENAYLKRLMIMRLHKAAGLMSETMLHEMAHWQTNLVSEEVITKAFQTIDTKVTQTMIYKIAPHLKPEKAVSTFGARVWKGILSVLNFTGLVKSV